MNINLIYIALIALLWGICPHLDKLVLDHIEYDQYWIISRCWINGLIILLIISIFFIKKTDIRKNVRKVSSKAWIFAISAAIIGNLALFINYYIIRRTGVSETVAILNPLAFLITIMYGYLLFGEKLNKNQIIGLSLTMVGIYITTTNSKKFK